MNAADILARVRITDLWQGLGGGPLRHGRGRAFWRDGDGYHVSLSNPKGTWFDHARGEGGGILDLIVMVRGSSRADALAWLADYAGLPLERTTPQARRLWLHQRDEMRAAQSWGLAAEAVAEAVLKELTSGDPRRAGLTRLLTIIRSGGAGLIGEYRDWSTDMPELTAAVMRAGIDAARRRELALAALISQRGANAAAA